jgi:catechol 2,3-dioxygenase-like lactoylglutathione lyase family enzyme
VKTTAFRHFAIRTKDIEAARRFYEQGLGLAFVGFRPNSTSMDLSDGAVNLTLIPYEGQERRPLEEGTEFIHLGFLVDDLAATYRRLLALGAPVVRDDVKERRPHDDDAVPAGSFKAPDPDGNVINISDRRDEWRLA